MIVTNDTGNVSHLTNHMVMIITCGVSGLRVALQIDTFRSLGRDSTVQHRSNYQNINSLYKEQDLNTRKKLPNT